MIDQTITPPPTAPTSTDSSTFRLRSDAFVAWIVTFVTQMISAITQMNALEVNVNAKEASTVSASNIAVASANFQGTWVNQTTVVGQSWAFETSIYRVLIAGNTSPITSPSNWKNLYDSIVLTGSPTAPTATAGTNTTQLATTAFVQPKRMVQNLNVTTGAVATGTTIIPLDNTIPQITEGTQFMSLAITPTSSTSILEITVVCASNESRVVLNHIATCLFRDAVADALATQLVVVSADRGVPAYFVHRMVAGTTAEIIFRVRIGGSDAATIGFNSYLGAQHGGRLSSSITIKEYLA